MATVKIAISIPVELLEQIDEAAKANFESRSDYLRHAAVLRLNDQRIADRPKEASVEEEVQAIFQKAIEEEARELDEN